MSSTVISMLKLAVVFAAVIVAMSLKVKLAVSVAVASVICVLLFQLSLSDTINVIVDVLTSKDFLLVIRILYCITFLQRMLESRNQLKLAQQDLDNIFHNRRINATVAPILIGLLPSPAAAIICGEIVSDAAGDALDKNEKAAVTSYYRHIPESFLPTYSAVIIMASISRVPVGSFVLGMLPLIAVMYLLGYVFYIKKIPHSGNVSTDAGTVIKGLIDLFKHLWTIIAIVVLIMLFKLSTLTATLIILALAWFFYSFKPDDRLPLAKRSLDVSLMTVTFAVYVFKEILSATGVIKDIPVFFSSLSIPPLYVFVLMFFVGTVVLGSKAIVTICTPLAFAAIPQGGWPLMVLLHTCAYAAMQISPTHVCMVIIADYFKSTLGAMSRKLLAIVLLLVVISTGYYHLLKLFF
ncbi:MAG: DUF401 family protein [Erysipelotrichaceae bacterium]|nr:DUF401 family protein [Erysipelotrichaceae bacterium]